MLTELVVFSMLWSQALPFPGPGMPAGGTPITLTAQCVSATAQGSDTTIACSSTVNIPSGAAVAVFIRFGDESQSVTGVSDGTNTYTSTTSCPVGGGGEVQWWYLQNATANATATITATFSAGTSFRALWAGVVTGISTSAALDAGPACNNGTGTAMATATYSTAAANEILLTGVSVAALSVTYTAGSGYTLGTALADQDMRTQYQIVSATQTNVTGDMTKTGTDAWIASQMTLKQ